MKAIIMQHGRNGSYVMDQEGCFQFVKGCQNKPIGAEITLRARPSASVRAIAAIAACLVLLFSINFVVGLWNTEYYSVYVDINPSVQLVFNRFNRLRAANPLNGDGADLLEGLSLRGKAGDMVVSLIQAAEQKHYLTPQGGSPEVAVTVTGRSDGVSGQSVLVIDTALIKNGMRERVVIETCGPDYRSRAEGLGISPGKLMLAERLMDSDPSLAIGDVAQQPIVTLMAGIREAQERIINPAPDSGVAANNQNVNPGGGGVNEGKPAGTVAAIGAKDDEPAFFLIGKTDIPLGFAPTVGMAGPDDITGLDVLPKPVDITNLVGMLNLPEITYLGGAGDTGDDDGLNGEGDPLGENAPGGEAEMPPVLLRRGDRMLPPYETAGYPDDTGLKGGAGIPVLLGKPAGNPDEDGLSHYINIAQGVDLVTDGSGSWWIVISDPYLRGELDIVYNMGDEYFITTLVIEGEGRYRVGDGRGGDGLNRVTVGGDMVPDGADVPGGELPAIINLGFIGYFMDGNGNCGASLYWVRLMEEDPAVDWSAVLAAFEDWVEKGGLNTKFEGWEAVDIGSITLTESDSFGGFWFFVPAEEGKAPPPLTGAGVDYGNAAVIIVPDDEMDDGDTNNGGENNGGTNNGGTNNGEPGNGGEAGNGGGNNGGENNGGGNNGGVNNGNPANGGGNPNNGGTNNGGTNNGTPNNANPNNGGTNNANPGNGNPGNGNPGNGNPGNGNPGNGNPGNGNPGNGNPGNGNPGNGNPGNGNPGNGNPGNSNPGNGNPGGGSSGNGNGGDSAGSSAPSTSEGSGDIT